MTIQINAAFDSGNIRLLDIDGDTLNLEIVPDHLSEFYQWFHFRVAGARGRCGLRSTLPRNRPAAADPPPTR